MPGLETPMRLWKKVWPTSKRQANKLAREYSVMLAPGSAFGFEHHLRIGIGQEPSVFSAGLERASACFADLEAAGVGRIGPSHNQQSSRWT